MLSGPLMYLVVGFEGNRFSGEILTELQALKDQGIARVDDLVVIKRNKQGEITKLELSDLSPDEAAPFRPFSGNLMGLFTEEDVAALAAEIPNDCSAAILLLEFLWAARLRDAIVRANGILFSEGLVPMDVVRDIDAELTATSPEPGPDVYAH
jgi:Family of unknown function (DUF6325)